MKELARGIKINFIGNIFRTSRAAFFLLAALLYGAEKFGIYTLVWNLIELVILFGTFGIDQDLLFELAHLRKIGDEEKLYRKLALVLKSCLVVSCLEAVLIGIYVAVSVDVPETRRAFYLLLPAVPLYMMSGVMLRAIMGLKEMKYNAIIRSIVEPALLLLFLLIFQKTSFRSDGIILAQSGALCLSSVLSAFAFGRFFSWKKVCQVSAKRGWSFHVPRYSLPLYLIEAFDNILYRTDIFLIGGILGTGSVEQQKLLGVYGLAKQIARAANQTKKAVGPIFIPVTSESFLSQDRQSLAEQTRYALERIFLLNIAITLFLGFFGRELIGLLGKDADMVTSGTFLWLLAGQVAFSTFSVLIYFLIATRSAKRLVFAALAVFGTMGLVGGTAISRWGVLGAAVVMGVGYLIVCLTALLETVHHHGEIYISRNSIKILASGLLAAVLIFALKVIPLPEGNGWVRILAAFLPGFGVYLALTVSREQWRALLRI